MPQEWSESGRRLLDTIQQIIDDNGGIETMHAKVLKEISPEPHRPDRRGTIEKIRLLATVFGVHKIHEIIGLTETEIYRIMHEEKIPFKNGRVKDIY